MLVNVQLVEEKVMIAALGEVKASVFVGWRKKMWTLRYRLEPLILAG